MPDVVEEYIAKQKERARSTAITTVALMLLIIAAFVYSIYDDKNRQKQLYTNGGAVGVENQTDHQVTLYLFQHDDAETRVITQTIEPRGHWVIRDSMSKSEVSNFPPAHWLDSGHLVFDDTLLLRHVSESPWYIPYDAHCIHDGAHWRYESLTVRRSSRYHPALYRPLRVYYITDKDYNRAVHQR